MRFPMTEAEVTIHQARVHAGRGMAVSSREKLNHEAANAKNDPSTVRPQRAKTPNGTLKLELPVPPSTNLAYRNMKDKGGRALSRASKKKDGKR